MECILLHNNSVRNKINKTIEQLETVEIVFLTSERVLKPVLKLKTFNPNANYVFIETLKRYYFIENVVILHNSLFQLELSVDVLYTYRDSIMNNPCNVIASDNVLNDNSVDYEEEGVSTTINYPLETPFSDVKDVVLIGV